MSRPYLALLGALFLFAGCQSVPAVTRAIVHLLASSQDTNSPPGTEIHDLPWRP